MHNPQTKKASLQGSDVHNQETILKHQQDKIGNANTIYRVKITQAIDEIAAALLAIIFSEFLTHVFEDIIHHHN